MNFAAAANVRALTTTATDRVLNVGTQTEVSVNQLAELLAEVSGARVPVAYEPARPGDILRSMLRNADVRRHLSWEPATSLKEGLARTYRSLQF